MKVRFVRPARLELLDALAYYQALSPELGKRFWHEIKAHVAWIQRHPNLPRLRSGYRRVNLRLFPYHLAYVIRNTTVWVLAVAHDRRRPRYWVERMETPGLQEAREEGTPP